VSRASARHRKPSRSVARASTAPSGSTTPARASTAPRASTTPARASTTPARSSTPTRHRKPSPVASVLRHKPAWAAATVAGSALIASAGLTAPHWLGEPPRPAAMDNAGRLHSPQASARADSLQASVRPDTRPSLQAGAGPISNATAGFSRLRIEHVPKRRTHPPAQPQAPAQTGYQNPLRNVSGLIAERVDMGADFGGSGPVYAIGDGVITNATGSSGGWPGGGWITYKLTDGPDAGLMVYVAEDVTPTVQPGQHVTSSTVVANMYNGGDGIETGWAMQDGASAESEMTEAGGISGGGPFPTMIGLSFEGLLRSLGVPAGNNAGASGFGTLPTGYPAG
jgi:murein DD-endopeptidase MepM/ murein hydrolase activator NlpD